MRPSEACNNSDPARAQAQHEPFAKDTSHRGAHQTMQLCRNRAKLKRTWIVGAVAGTGLQRRMAKQGQIRAGVGGWTFEPWRGVFYPKGLPHARELEYASQHLTTIEINGTFYRTQTPATFAKWRKETPEGFVFSVKGVRYAVNRRVLAEAGDCIKRFLDFGRDGTRPAAGATAVAVRGHQEVRRGGLRQVPRALPAKLGGTSCAMWWSRGTPRS